MSSTTNSTQHDAAHVFCNIAQLKEGDYLSLTQYLKVIRTDGMRVHVKTVQGDTWQVDRAIVEKDCCHLQFTKIEKVSLTELGRIIREDVKDAVFEVQFTKQQTVEAVAKTLEEIAPTLATCTAADRKRKAKDLLSGETRVMRCHFLGVDPNGRFRVIDLEANGLRLVDSRSLEYVVVKGIKYELK
jgi:hypothetical protein